VPGKKVVVDIQCGGRNCDCTKIDREKMNLKCWSILKKTDITNPEKDIVFKLWHHRGLSPPMAQALRLYSSRDCPFCNENDIKTSHYPFCDNFTSLWTLIFKIINIKPPVSLQTAVLGDPTNLTTNLFIFYGLIVIYRAFLHALNNFNGTYDPISKFRHLVFGRLLSEYQVAARRGTDAVEVFHRKWSKFKIYQIKNNQIDIKIG